MARTGTSRAEGQVVQEAEQQHQYVQQHAVHENIYDGA
jgi:hypothetical protein